MRDIRKALKGLSADQIEERFGPVVRATFEVCRKGASPADQDLPQGVRYLAALEGAAQYRSEWKLNRRVRLARMAALVLLVPAWVQAAPFLYSDPWPAGSEPDTCVAVEGAVTTPLDLVGSPKYIKDDLSGMTGAHTWVITCTNAWGSSSPVNFTFKAGAPTAPVGIRIAQ
jgi:hypothetical protein